VVTLRGQRGRRSRAHSPGPAHSGAHPPSPLFPLPTDSYLHAHHHLDTRSIPERLLPQTALAVARASGSTRRAGRLIPVRGRQLTPPRLVHPSHLAPHLVCHRSRCRRTRRHTSPAPTGSDRRVSRRPAHSRPLPSQIASRLQVGRPSNSRARASRSRLRGAKRPRRGSTSTIC
jgi:hypothetical protein